MKSPNTIHLGIVMDPIESINPKKDSSLAMLLQAQARDWVIWYIQTTGLYMLDGKAYAQASQLKVYDHSEHWFDLSAKQELSLAQLDLILMRKDPPVNADYIYATYILEQAESTKTLVMNKPQALRDANEKLFALRFPQCCPPSIVSTSRDQIRAFLDHHNDIIIKPLDAMGGQSVFRLSTGDPNINVILETATANGTSLTMAQRFIPEITHGDKRVLLIDGRPVAYALARIPAAGETRANLALGGHGKGIHLSKRDEWIAQQVGQECRSRGLLFVGLDIIGDYLTEINVTSPTCIRELDKIFNLNIAAQLLDCLLQKLQER